MDNLMLYLTWVRFGACYLGRMTPLNPIPSQSHQYITKDTRRRRVFFSPLELYTEPMEQVSSSQTALGMHQS